MDERIERKSKVYPEGAFVKQDEKAATRDFIRKINEQMEAKLASSRLQDKLSLEDVVEQDRPVAENFVC